MPSDRVIGGNLGLPDGTWKFGYNTKTGAVKATWVPGPLVDAPGHVMPKSLSRVTLRIWNIDKPALPAYNDPQYISRLLIEQSVEIIGSEQRNIQGDMGQPTLDDYLIFGLTIEGNDASHADVCSEGNMVRPFPASSTFLLFSNNIIPTLFHILPEFRSAAFDMLRTAKSIAPSHSLLGVASTR